MSLQSDQQVVRAAQSPIPSIMGLTQETGDWLEDHFVPKLLPGFYRPCFLLATAAPRCSECIPRVQRGEPSWNVRCSPLMYMDTVQETSPHHTAASLSAVRLFG